MRWTTRFCMLLVILSLVMSCAPSSPSSPSTNAPTPSQTPSQVPTSTPAPSLVPGKALPAPGVAVKGTIDKSYYLSGENVVAKFSLQTQNHPDPFEIKPFPPLIQVIRYNHNTSLNTSQVVRTFPAGTATRLLTLGEVVDYLQNWDQRNDQGQPVPYGYYQVNLGPIPTKYGSNEGHTPPFPVLPAGGALEKTIEVNQSQTADGITIKLERVELSNTGMNISVSVLNPPRFELPTGPSPTPKSPGPTPAVPQGNRATPATPPGNPSYPGVTPAPPITDYPSPPKSPTVPPSPPKFYYVVDMAAEYRLDGGTAQDAGRAYIHAFEPKPLGVRWSALDPVPKSTRLLSLTLYNLRGSTGIWQFQVQLQ